MNDRSVNPDMVINPYRQALFNIKNLPSIPLVMMEVTQLLSNSKTSATELGKTISTDQGLVAKVLAVANSPFYGLPRRVSTIEFAIVILGFDHIKNIVIALSMIEAFKNKDDNNWNRKKYWQHSLYTATAAKRLADDLGFAKSGEAFTAGLLHDLGISVMQRYFKDEYGQVCRLVKDKQISYLNAEIEIFGITHPEVGEYLLDRWNLPKTLSDAIRYHHKPSVAEDNQVLTAIIHVADYMSQRYQKSSLLWDSNYQVDNSVIDILKLGNEEYLEKLMETYQQLFDLQTETYLP